MAYIGLAMILMIFIALGFLVVRSEGWTVAIQIFALTGGIGAWVAVACYCMSQGY